MSDTSTEPARAAIREISRENDVRREPAIGPFGPIDTAAARVHLLDPDGDSDHWFSTCCGYWRGDGAARDPRKATCHDCLRAILDKWRPMVDAASDRLDELTCAAPAFDPTAPRPLDGATIESDAACPADRVYFLGSEFKP